MSADASLFHVMLSPAGRWARQPVITAWGDWFCRELPLEAHQYSLPGTSA